MVKKILSLALVSLMLAVPVAFADTVAETNTWTEDFTGAEVAAYNSETKAYEITGTDFSITASSDVSSAAKMEIKYGVSGKKNSDAALMIEDTAVNYYSQKTLVKEFANPYVIDEDNPIVHIGFDWLAHEKNAHHSRNIKQIILNVELKDGQGATHNNDVVVGGMGGYQYYTSTQSTTDEPGLALNSEITSGSWETMNLYVDADSVSIWDIKNSKMTDTAISGWVAQNNTIEDDPDTDETETSKSLAGFTISKINSMKITMRTTSNATVFDARRFGFDNFIFEYVKAIPESIASKRNLFCDYVNHYSNPVSLLTDYSNGFATSTLVSWSTLTSLLDTELVISNEAKSGVHSGAYRSSYKATGKMKPLAGEKMQFSFDYKYDSKIGSKYDFFAVYPVVYRGNVAQCVFFGSDGSLRSGSGGDALATLEPGKWYSVDILFTMHDSVVDNNIDKDISADVYLDGKYMFTKGVTLVSQNVYNDQVMIYFDYNPAVGEAETYANAVHIDNVCVNVFGAGETPYNFDKTLDSTSNKVLAGAEEDVVNGILAPVSSEWTVADFNALGLTNAKIVDTENKAEVTDETALIKDNLIAISGDYGKTVYYTISSEGATHVGKDYMVIAKQNGEVLSNNGNAAQGAAVATTAVLADSEAESVIIAAEYNGKQLVKVSLEGASYSPQASGNTVKLFVWNNESKIEPVAAMTTLNVANAAAE